MGVSGVAFRQIPFLSGANPSKPTLSVTPRAVVFSGEKGRAGLCRSLVSRASGFLSSGFSDEGHMEYYRGKTRCGGKKEKGFGAMKTKKKLKLLKGLLSEDSSMLSGLGSGFGGGETQIGLVDEVQGKLISEAAEVLIKQLEQVREEEKELKRKKKLEKAKLKASRMKDSSSSSSSSSSESETGEVVDMSSLKRNVLQQPITGTTQILASPTLLVSPPTQETRSTQHNDSSTRNSPSIEVCMGGKCKKSGAGALLEEFERVLGIEGGAVGCKCMGKCKDGPNVRIRNCVDEAQSEMLDDSVRTPSNPVCIKVGMEDVGVIVAKFLGEDQKELGATSCNSL